MVAQYTDAIDVLELLLHQEPGNQRHKDRLDDGATMRNRPASFCERSDARALPRLPRAPTRISRSNALRLARARIPWGHAVRGQQIIAPPSTLAGRYAASFVRPTGCRLACPRDNADPPQHTAPCTG